MTCKLSLSVALLLISATAVSSEEKTETRHYGGNHQGEGIISGVGGAGHLGVGSVHLGGTVGGTQHSGGIGSGYGGGGLGGNIVPGGGIIPGGAIGGSIVAGDVIVPGGGGYGGSSASCRYWCRTPEGQAYCCEGNNEPVAAYPSVKPGRCPPVRPQCPPVRGILPPISCSNDSKCPGAEKCCFDRCLEQHVCKYPVRY
ncbi:hypothetical protein SK128_007990 [Halocaridina rubra]|uniref:WAP domain-containing protein n=1 Tax=Halocaridina rubra TaxID=373956 RepID=A0AAN8WN47_HALRR